MIPTWAVGGFADAVAFAFRGAARVGGLDTLGRLMDAYEQIYREIA